MANNSKVTTLEVAGGSESPQDHGDPVVRTVTEPADPRETILRAMVTAATRPVDYTYERDTLKLLTIEHVKDRERTLKGAQHLYHAKVAPVLLEDQNRKGSV